MSITGTNLIWDPVNEDAKAVAEPAAPKKSAGSESVHGDGEMTEDGIPSSVKGGSDCVIDVAEATGGKYNIRVLIPCYKEDADIVEKTIVAIRTAVLPPGEQMLQGTPATCSAMPSTLLGGHHTCHLGGHEMHQAWLPLQLSVEVCECSHTAIGLNLEGLGCLQGAPARSMCAMMGRTARSGAAASASAGTVSMCRGVHVPRTR